MEKEELIELLGYVFDHYLDSDLGDEQREDVEKAYQKMKNIIQNS